MHILIDVKRESSQIEDIVLAKQVHPIFKSTLVGGLSNIFAAILTYLLLMNNHQQIEALIISSSIIILSIIRIIISNTYLKLAIKFNLNRYLFSHFSFTFLIGACWGSFALMQISQENELTRNIIFLINFGLIAASIATLSAWIPTYLAYMLPQSVAVFSVFIIQATEHSYYMAISFLIFTGIMISTSINVNRRHKNELRLELKNKELIDYLSDEVGKRIEVQEQLEDNKRELERKVEERTNELTLINRDLESEIKEKVQAEVNLEYMAYHDDLTGLPNKALLVDRITQAIETANRYDNKLGILFLDLDRFKKVNDSLGHVVGDKLIQEVSNRLMQTIRKEDTISRYSGDEFVIVIQKMSSSEEAILVAKKIIKILTSNFDIDSHQVHIGASIGISVYPTDATTPLELLRSADTAMFRAKTAGGNRLQFYDQSMSNVLTQRLQLENELHAALDNNEFHLVYQPQIDCRNGQTTGFETLLRWDNPTLGSVSPDLFIPVLEETGLIYTVGEWVIKQAIQFIHTMQISELTLAINLSTLQCKDISLIVLLKEEVRRTGINPAQLEFEITESLLINDFDKTEIFLNALHDIGCTIALDDFGTGYTSMGYLTRLPIDIIKVDKSFIRDINSNNTLYNIVKAIVKMSNSLGIRNVFEGIETEEELEVVKHLDGHIIQGFLFSHAIKDCDVSSWLSLDTDTRLQLVK